jgi:hypothetical protein
LGLINTPRNLTQRDKPAIVRQRPERESLLIRTVVGRRRY